MVKRRVVNSEWCVFNSVFVISKWRVKIEYTTSTVQPNAPHPMTNDSAAND